jgi:hypothetical protein
MTNSEGYEETEVQKFLEFFEGLDPVVDDYYNTIDMPPIILNVFEEEAEKCIKGLKWLVCELLRRKIKTKKLTAYDVVLSVADLEYETAFDLAQKVVEFRWKDIGYFKLCSYTGITETQFYLTYTKDRVKLPKLRMLMVSLEKLYLRPRLKMWADESTIEVLIECDYSLSSTLMLSDSQNLI